ncbi:ribosome maturation factor RimM [Pedomonas sp. V897]|uniref:ribosome maturation factor RimM n=1 Tax=Pedomonas sp. V897 TaxID=3446482 RepID=UPI003EE2EED6
MAVRDEAPRKGDDTGRTAGNPPAGKSILLGVITGPQGLQGEVRIRPFTDDPGGLERYKTLHAGNRTLTVVKVRVQPNGVIARFREITDRTAAEQMRGVELSIPREALPAPEEGEFYQIDLIGLTAVTPDGAVIGEVVAIPNYGSSDLLEIRTTAGKTHLVPFIDDAVPDVLQDEGRIVIDPAFLA